MRNLARPTLWIGIALIAAVHAPPANAGDCCGIGFGGFTVPNVFWALQDSVAACPAGDSLLADHASRLRIRVQYEDATCCAKVGVPPESIWVVVQSTTGNLSANDKGAVIFADDSTDAAGQSRITIPSFSGCGTVTLRLYVAGVSQGTKQALVRSADGGGDGRTDIDDVKSACDLNYDGSVDGGDTSPMAAHFDHWHRNALHGTLVRRTNFSTSSASLGSGRIFWSPSGRYLSFGVHPPGPCAIFIAPSDPADGGNALRQVTFPPPGRPDYDPSWSPLNSLMIYARDDTTIFAHSLQGFGGDGGTYVVARHSDGLLDPRGAIVGTISPNGQWVAFSRRDVAFGPINIYIIPISGDETKLRKLTDADAADWYPAWSTDGQWITFQRESPTDPYYRLLRVSASGDSTQTPQEVYTNALGKPSLDDATTPVYSADGLIMIAGVGPRTTDAVVTRTLDLSLSTKPAVANYTGGEFAAKRELPDFPILSPIPSPDGTRLALASDEIWAARRNMNLPPRITSVGGNAVDDTAATVSLFAFSSQTNFFTVVASDPEGDPITCSAFFLEQPWMGFSQSLCRLSLQPPSSEAGKTFVVKLIVTTASGGTDVINALIVVDPSGPGFSTGRPVRQEPEPETGPNPTRGSFSIMAPFVSGTMARLTILDVTGRRVASVRGRSGSTLTWDGRTSAGIRAATGVYVWRLEVP